MDFGLEVVILVAIIVGIVGACAGYMIAMAGERRAGGGKTVAELADEHEQYREGVSEHFKTTAALLHEMTDKYREVYTHMAEGAQSLVSSESALPALEQLRGDLPDRDAKALVERSAVEPNPASEPVGEGGAGGSSEVADDNADVKVSPADGETGQGFFGKDKSSDEPAPSGGEAVSDPPAEIAAESEAETPAEPAR